MSNHLYRLEVKRTKKDMVIRAVGRGPRGHNFTLAVVEVPLEAYPAWRDDGGMAKFLEPVSAAPRKNR